MPRKNDSFINDLVACPWWISLILAVSTFVALKFLYPSLAAIGAMVFLATAVVSAIKAYESGTLLKSQTSLESIRALSWREFEKLIAEAYRMNGYQVEGNSGAGADGGVDVVARKDGRTTLIQCKQWKTQSIGVKVIREMYGIMCAEKADAVHVVGTGGFTKDAIGFAEGKPVELLGGSEVMKLVKKAQGAANEEN